MKAKITFHATITVLSPLHIGNGDTLREGFDFIEKDGYLWIADQRKLLHSIWADAEGPDQEEDVSIDGILSLTLQEMFDAGWLRPEYFDISKGLFKYRLRGETSTREKRGVLLPFIKTIYGQPYLPGSSLKGALRTGLAWWFTNRTQPEIRLTKPRGRDIRQDAHIFYLGNRAKSAAKDAESKLFGQDPNHDLLRFLIVRDSVPLSNHALCLGTTHLIPDTDSRDRLTIDMEFLGPGTEIHQTMLLDTFLLEDPRTHDLLRYLHDPHNRKRWLRNLAKTMQNYTRRRLVDEIQWFQKHRGPREAIRLFHTMANQILDEQLQPNEFFIQLGWGAGWDSKTLDGELRKDAKLFTDIVNQFQLHKGPQRLQGAFMPGEDFPRTRKVATLKYCGSSNLPLGWVKVRLEEV